MAYRVLLVDDSPAMRAFIRRVMVLSGFDLDECIEAGDGAEALEALQREKVDVILTDINMPRMDGEELMRRLSEDKDLREIPAVVVSTDSTRPRILRMIGLGAQGYVAKPFSPEALREALEKVLECSV
ncbi:MAG: response regulator [Bryobacteraceae bacterium]|jgi:two-component system chemotaxis response regulator CheY